MVLQPSEPRITISGADRLVRPESDFGGADGVALFQDLHIVSTVTRTDAAVRHAGATRSRYNLHFYVSEKLLRAAFLREEILETARQ